MIGDLVKFNFLSSRGIRQLQKSRDQHTWHLVVSPSPRKAGTWQAAGFYFLLLLPFFVSVWILFFEEGGKPFTVFRAWDVLVPGRGLCLGLLSPWAVGGSVGRCGGPGPSSLPLRSPEKPGSRWELRAEGLLMAGQPYVVQPPPRCPFLPSRAAPA